MRCICLVAGAVLSLNSGFTNASEQNTSEYLLSYNLFQLGSVQTYTASRYLTPLADTPANIHIITAEQIEQRSYRSLYDVLRHTPGFFFFTHNQEIRTATRGIPQIADGYALVIDNNLISSSFSNRFVFPSISNVKQIEIISGSSAVLWGDSASLGIIHIITKDGEDYADEGVNWQVSADYEIDDQRYIQNLTYGNAWGDRSALISLSSFDSDSAWARGYSVDENGPAPDSSGRAMGDFDFDRSYDLYVRLKSEKFGLNIKQDKFGYHGGVPDSYNENYLAHSHVDLNYQNDLSDVYKMESRLFNTRTTQSEDFLDSFDNEINRSEYSVKTLGAEVIFNRRSEDNILLTGIYGHYRRFRNNYNLDDFLTLDKSQKNIALFFENTYSGLDKFTLGIGGRYSVNYDELYKRESFLPKLSLTYELNSNSQISYQYNKADFLPYALNDNISNYTTSAMNSQLLYGVDEEQVFDFHDLKYSFTADDLSMDLGFYYVEATNIPVAIWEDKTSSNFFRVNDRENFNSDVISKGIQFSVKKPFDVFKLYGHLNYANTRSDEVYEEFYSELNFPGFNFFSQTQLNSMVTDQYQYIAAPEYTLLLGADIPLKNKLNLNLQYTGYFGVSSRSKQVDDPARFSGKESYYEQLAPMHFVDMSVLGKDVGYQGLDLNFYIKNLFDSHERLVDTFDGAYTNDTYRRKFGLGVNYAF